MAGATPGDRCRCREAAVTGSDTAGRTEVMDGASRAGRESRVKSGSQVQLGWMVEPLNVYNKHNFAVAWKLDPTQLGLSWDVESAIFV